MSSRKAFFDAYKERHKGKRAPRIIVISNGGFAEQSQFQALEFMMDRMARNMSSEVIAKIFRGQGPILAMENEQLKPIIDNYRELLQQAGGEIATQWCISKQTQEKLDAPLIPVDVYNQQINNR